MLLEVIMVIGSDWMLLWLLEVIRGYWELLSQACSAE